MEVLKVSTKSSPNSVAGALAGVIREQGVVEIQIVGAGALNQAVKAIAIARGFVAPMGLDLICTPAFADIEINGEERTAIRLLVEPRHAASPVSADGLARPPPALHRVRRHAVAAAIVEAAARVGLPRDRAHRPRHRRAVWPKRLPACRGTPVTVIPGVELSAGVGDRGIHVLGYHIDHTDAHSCDQLERLRCHPRRARGAHRLRARPRRIRDLRSRTSSLSRTEEPSDAHTSPSCW